MTAIVPGLVLRDVRVEGTITVVSVPTAEDGRNGRVVFEGGYSKALWLLRDQMAAGKIVEVKS